MQAAPSASFPVPPPKTPSTAGGPAPGKPNRLARAFLTHGFCTILEEEYELLTTIGASVENVEGPQAAYLQRILRTHHEQVAAVIASLTERMERLPQAGRLLTSLATHSLELPAGNAAQRAQPGALARLVARHLALLSNLETLAEAVGHRPSDASFLRRTGQRHDDMAWVLSALLREEESGVSATAPASGPVVVADQGDVAANATAPTKVS